MLGLAGSEIAPVVEGETMIMVIAKMGEARLGAEVQVTVKNTKDDLVSFARDAMPVINRLGCNAARTA